MEEMESQQRYIQDQRGSITKALESGIAQGRQEGRQEGLQQGQQNEKIAIAQRSLPLMDDATIAAITGLTIDEIQSLRSPIT